MISRFHCQIHRKGNKLYIVDCKSANGTWVDQKRIKPGEFMPVKKGGRIDLAGVCMMRVGVEKVKKGDEKKVAAGIGRT
jgi:pSer/pThr/pTyr-binding forkhead associated (FHA) protein